MLAGWQSSGTSAVWWDLSKACDLHKCVNKNIMGHMESVICWVGSAVVLDNCSLFSNDYWIWYPDIPSVWLHPERWWHKTFVIEKNWSYWQVLVTVTRYWVLLYHHTANRLIQVWLRSSGKNENHFFFSLRIKIMIFSHDSKRKPFFNKKKCIAINIVFIQIVHGI